MLCDICHIRPATIQFTQISHQQKIEKQICKTCAEEKGYTKLQVSDQSQPGDAQLTSGQQPSAPIEFREHFARLCCERCHLTWEQFEIDRLLGCPKCYQAFQEPLGAMLQRIHGTHQHIGNRPANLRIRTENLDLNQLKADLKSAISAQNYELAAGLRDQIKDAEANLKRRSQ